MLSLSRMRAEARSLMMYCRRTCLKTGTKRDPSSVFKKGSSSASSAQNETSGQTGQSVVNFVNRK